MLTSMLAANWLRDALTRRLFTCCCWCGEYNRLNVTVCLLHSWCVVIMKEDLGSVLYWTVYYRGAMKIYFITWRRQLHTGVANNTRHIPHSASVGEMWLLSCFDKCVIWDRTALAVDPLLWLGVLVEWQQSGSRFWQWTQGGFHCCSNWPKPNPHQGWENTRVNYSAR